MFEKRATRTAGFQPADSVGPAGWKPAVRGLLAAFALLFTAPFVRAEPVRSDHVEAEFHAARTAVAPGETFTVVLRQTMAEGWHTYWRNPGDSGQATEVSWTQTPSGFRVGELQWPAPIRLPADASIMQYAYGGEVLLPFEVTVPAQARVGATARFTADVSWLECADVCIPADVHMAFAVPVRTEGADDPIWAPRIAEAVAALPRAGVLEARITKEGENGLLTIASDARVRNAHFFPYRQDVIVHSAPEGFSAGPSGFSFVLQPGFGADFARAPLDGVVTFEARGPGGWQAQAFEVHATPGAPLDGATGAPAAPAPAQGDASLPVALVFALLGGLLLNVMPCVFPVLSLKALSLTQADEKDARSNGLWFFAGVMATFLALAGVLIALKGAGQAVGWGFQLQEPLFVAALATLFFVIGLNLAGVFEIGGALQNLGNGIAARSGALGAFFTGALAVVAATPCTAAFMATATGYAAAHSAPEALAVFALLGVGFAAPFVALSFWPAARRFLPKPGPWMERAKIVLAFPMFATAAWLAWVLTEQTGANGLLALLALATALAFALVIGRWGAPWRIAGIAAVLLVAFMSWRPLSAPPATAATLDAQAWSPARVTALVDQGKGVFVDFTAAWCVTCQVNKATTLQSARVVQAFAQHDIVFLEADWTNRDAEIARALAQFGRDGVPLYLYYPPGEARPRILPQILTEGIVLDAIAEQGERP